ncbi:MAG: hypothetical protein ACFNUL_03785, partial [Cardiobacterium hominis]
MARLLSPLLLHSIGAFPQCGIVEIMLFCPRARLSIMRGMTTLLHPDLSPEKNARLLFWRGFTCAEIARLMGIP